jgi:hypothetical protein
MVSPDDSKVAVHNGDNNDDEEEERKRKFIIPSKSNYFKHVTRSLPSLEEDILDFDEQSQSKAQKRIVRRRDRNAQSLEEWGKQWAKIQVTKPTRITCKKPLTSAPPRAVNPLSPDMLSDAVLEDSQTTPIVANSFEMVEEIQSDTAEELDNSSNRAKRRKVQRFPSSKVSGNGTTGKSRVIVPSSFSDDLVESDFSEVKIEDEEEKIASNSEGEGKLGVKSLPEKNTSAQEKKLKSSHSSMATSEEKKSSASTNKKKILEAQFRFDFPSFCCSYSDKFFFLFFVILNFFLQITNQVVFLYLFVFLS